MEIDQANSGDIVRLVENWQDESGIPCFAHPEGSEFVVLLPDMTTGGIVVWDGEIPFSLTPEQYEVVRQAPNGGFGAKIVQALLGEAQG